MAKPKASAAKKKSVTRPPAVSPAAYPRPMLRRETWQPLNGEWAFALDAEAQHDTVDTVDFSQKITVPFAPETPASGVGYTGFIRRCWYRRSFNTPALREGQRLILHFEAVDYEAAVWVNGVLAARHEGGYAPFSADITDHLTDGPSQTVVVRADDDPHDLAKPRGKQDWHLEAHSIWYPRTSGIWQTVWLETVPAIHVQELRWTPFAEAGNVELQAAITAGGAAIPAGTCLQITLTFGGRTLVDDVVSVPSDGLVRRLLPVTRSHVEDFAADVLWSPDHPNLIDAVLTVLDDTGAPADRVESYTALRSVRLDGDRFLLNRREWKLRLVLDQGYWPESGMTAPDDEALRRDVELVKELGFNGVRKHQKIESRRFLYWADKLGLLVWEEMPSPYQFTPLAAERMARQWCDAIRRDISHPCIVAWVPVNESWGVPDLPTEPQQRHLVLGLYHLTHALDGTRPVIGNDGWEVVGGDITAVHDYAAQPDVLLRRYSMVPGQALVESLNHERPAGRRLVMGEYDPAGKPLMLTEFGGIGYSPHAGDWGYSRATSVEDFLGRYESLLAAVHSINRFAGFCYTQLTDTYQEANGLVYMDRSPKADLLRIATATRGG